MIAVRSIVSVLLGALAGTCVGDGMGMGCLKSTFHVTLDPIWLETPLHHSCDTVALTFDPLVFQLMSLSLSPALKHVSSLLLV